MPYPNTDQESTSSPTDTPSYNACPSPMEEQMHHKNTTPPPFYAVFLAQQPQASTQQPHSSLSSFSPRPQNRTHTFSSSSYCNTSSWLYPSVLHYFGSISYRPSPQNSVLERAPLMGRSRATQNRRTQRVLREEGGVCEGFEKMGGR
uniref:Uncharacterized protein n=1 Tax=Opuntia streptacantha TaxID=393608 RepID=A0A7C9D5Z6_OPUST